LIRPAVVSWNDIEPRLSGESSEFPLLRVSQRRTNDFPFWSRTVIFSFVGVVS
jgi:hypothetical protein